MFLFFGGFRIFFVLFTLVFALFPLLFFGLIFFFLSNSILKNQSIHTYINTQSTTHNKFIELFARTAAHLMKIDGEVAPVEIQTFKNFFITQLNFQGSSLLWVEDLLKKELTKQHNLEELIGEINSNFNNETKVVLLELLCQIAYSDFDFSSSEEALIQKISKMMGVMDRDYQYISNRYKKSSSDADINKYFKVLGVDKGASQDEIKTAYRTLIKKYHPDVVAHLGEEFKKVNEKKTREITEAYDALKKQ